MAARTRACTDEPRAVHRRLSNRLVVEEVSIADLRPDPSPQRKHSERQIAQIKGSLAQFDMVQPILVTDEGEVINGHAVLEAAKALGWQTAPVIRVSGLSKAQRRALMMALNRIGEHAKWDHDVLQADFLMLQADPEIDFSLDLTGFDQVFIDTLVLEGVAADQDDVPAVGDGPAVTRLGDMWLCGPHIIICGDSLQRETYERLMAGQLARLVLGDPPYNVPVNGHVSGLGKVKHREFAMASGEMDRPGFVAFQTTIFGQCAAFSVDGALHYYFMDGRHVRDQIEAGEAVFGDLKQLIVWVKDNAGMGAFYRSRHELVTVWKVGQAPHVNNFELGGTGRYRTNVWEYPGYSSLGAGRDEALSWHPTVKPLPMITDAILDVTAHGDVVLDPFGGSGTTLIAAERTKRIARLIEIDPQYVDVTLQRFITQTGEEPVLTETGETFAQVRERRDHEGADMQDAATISASEWDIL